MAAMYHVLLLILAGVTGAATSFQDAPATAPFSQVAPASQPVTPPPEVLDLVKQLDDPDYSVREQAERELFAAVASDSSIQAWIARAAQSDPSPEVRTRLASVMARVTEHRLLGATLISLKVSNVHPRDLVDELSKQSGVRFEYWPQDPWVGGAPGGKVSLELDRVPFWEALRRVSETISIQPVEHQAAAPGSIVLSQHAEQFGGYPTRHHGAFAVQLRRLYRNQSAQMELGIERDGRIAGSSHSDRSLGAELRLLVEPKVRLTGSMTQPLLEEAIDEDGNNLLLPNENRGMGARMGWPNAANPWAVQTNFSLDAKAAASSKRIARLRGRLEAEVALEVVTLELKLADFADMRKLRPDEKVPLSKRYTVGSYQIEFTSLRRSQEDAITVEFTITPQAGPPDQLQEEWARMQALSNNLRLEDASGRLWSNSGGGTSWDGSSAQITRGFHRGGDNAGPAVRLVWEIPAKIMPVSIPFEFQDIPLPSWE